MATQLPFPVTLPLRLLGHYPCDPVHAGTLMERRGARRTQATGALYSPKFNFEMHDVILFS